MVNRKMRISITLFGAVLAGVAAAQTYPVKPVRIVVPFAAGGGVDVTARILAQGLTERLGQNVFVENRTGASGIIGTEFVAKSAPDGYTLLVGSQTTQAVVPAMYKTSYDGARDFTPMMVIATSPLMIVVHPSLPVKNVKDLIALARARPGQLTFGAASGGTPHMAGELFKLTAKVDLLFVPYKGEGPAVSDAMGGQISTVFSNLPVVLPLVRSGRLRGIAVTSAQRVSTAAEFPTVAESGLPGFEANTWFGCLAPAGTPADIINKLNAESARALNAPAVKERMAGMGLFVVANKPEEFAELLKKEIPRWAKVVKESGVKPQ
ncbi:MAG: tripartite tricarboxylate transporter substrate binding protein [Burkholderiales bacterium]|jgi:tripartite-type tricarboxylate transporter receptor subunit TctC|nr:tripartite tricarboxylate transporter substrate binding protein [Burkholderiales bacterium]